MSGSGINNAILKQQNRGLILRLIITGKCSSRVEIAKETGLSKMAASNVIGEFMDAGIIEETEKQQVSGKGRNPVMLAISERAPKLIGVHISRNRCGVSLCTLDLRIKKEEYFDVTQENHGELFEKIYGIIDSMIRDCKRKKEKVLGIGVGTLGPMNAINGVILNPPNFYGIHDVDVLGEMKKRYDIPVFVEQEYDCAAMTELYFGAGRDKQDFVFIGVSWGVGGGIVANGRLRRNKAGFTCEFGHTCIDFNGPVCNCGRRGCVEIYTSTQTIEKRLREATGENLSFREFCDKYKKRAPEKVDEIFTDMAIKTSYGITNMVNAAGNQNFIIGHDGYYIPDRYIKLCEEEVNKRIMFRDYRKVSIIKSEKQSEVLSSNCAVAVLDRIFSGAIEIA